jgi:proteasome lid subunit RPN8/RPN11
MLDIQQQLLDLYNHEVSEERCGLVTDEGELIELDNGHDQPELGYVMNARQVLTAMDDYIITGTWHTHPDDDPNLSQEDYAGFSLWPDLIHYIVGMRDGAKTVASFAFQKDKLVTL